MANIIVVSSSAVPNLVGNRISRSSLRCGESRVRCSRGQFTGFTGRLRGISFRNPGLNFCKVSEEGSSLTEAKEDNEEEEGLISRKALQLVLWSLTGVYVLWLFILPFAPGDPAWAIDQQTLSMLLDLSLNFFFILPIANAVGFHLIESPVIHPTWESLFNLVMGWTLLFGPMIFSDLRSNRFKSSLETLWLGQWLLTNTFLIPYMAIRLNQAPDQILSSKTLSKFGLGIVAGAKYFAVAGGVVGVLSVVWAIGGRSEAEFGDLQQRWDYFVGLVRTDRVAYAFVWDLILYSIFQPWLIGSNTCNVRSSLTMQRAINILKYVPYVGMVVYLWGLSQYKRNVT